MNQNICKCIGVRTRSDNITNCKNCGKSIFERILPPISHNRNLFPQVEIIRPAESPSLGNRLSENTNSIIQRLGRSLRGIGTTRRNSSQSEISIDEATPSTNTGKNRNPEILLYNWHKDEN